MFSLTSDKLYYKISEVCSSTGLAPSVLRFWEKEFRSLRPTKSTTNQRLYSKKDIELIVKIKHLLYDEKYTIPGARRVIEQKLPVEAHRAQAGEEIVEHDDTSHDSPIESDLGEVQVLKEIRRELIEIRDLL